MKKVPKFDIKLSFTGNTLKGNKKNIENSFLLEKLFNKKINIHLKINLDKLEQQYNNKKLINKVPIIQEDYKGEEIIKNKKISKINLCNKLNFPKNQIIPKTYRSVSNQKKKIVSFKKNTLVLDLDETLVYVTDTKNNYLGLPQIQFNYYVYDECEKKIKENLNKLGINQIKKSTSFLTIRPNFNIFINILKKYYDEIVVFTSGQYSYAEEIIKIIDKQKIISKIYSRKDCSFYNDVFYKDLSKIKDDLSHIIIIDNYPESYLLQQFNGLPIPSFIGDPNDNELLKLIPILEKLSKAKDVRNYIGQMINFKTQKINFCKAYKILDIKRYTVSNGYNSTKEEYFKKNIIHDKSNRKIKKKFSLSEFNTSKINTNANDLTKGKNDKNKKEENNDDDILVNDPNNYFYIEKNDNYSSSRNENKINIFNLPKNFNFKKIKNKNKKNEKSENKESTQGITLSKKLNKNKRYITLKPQPINSITIDNSENYSVNNKEINNNGTNKIINELSVNPDYNIININPNISYFNNYEESFFSEGKKINSIKHSKNIIKNNVKKNHTYIFSYDKKSKSKNFIDKSKDKKLYCIPEVLDKTYAIKNKQINNKALDTLKEDNISECQKKFRKIKIHKMRQVVSFHDKKFPLSP